MKKLNNKVDKYNVYIDQLKNKNKDNTLTNLINYIKDNILVAGSIDKTMYDVLQTQNIQNIRDILKDGSKQDFSNISDDDIQYIINTY